LGLANKGPWILYGVFVKTGPAKPITCLPARHDWPAMIPWAGLRIRPGEPSVLRRRFHDRFNKALAAIKAGTYTASELSDKFILSVDQINALDAALIWLLPIFRISSCLVCEIDLTQSALVAGCGTHRWELLATGKLAQWAKAHPR
jgi:hypothetical protein